MVARVLILALSLLAATGSTTAQRIGPAAGDSGGRLLAGTPVASPAPVAAPRVVGQDELSVPGTILVPSPDGRLLAGTHDERRGALCVYAVASPQDEPTCLDPEGAGIVSIDFRHVAWSPDSTRLAFTEDFAITLVDSDVWMMDAATGEVRNLTDDGVAGDLLGTTGDDAALPPRDGFPAWSPDGREIAFVRGELGDDQRRTILMRVPASGGAADEIHEVSAEVPFAVRDRPAWTPDGAHLIFTVGHLDPDAPDNGIWIVGNDGGDPRHFAGTTDPELGYPILVAVSPRGDLALATYFAALRLVIDHPPLALVDLNTGAASPLERFDPNAPAGAYPFLAAFSPDGSRLVLIARGGPDVEEETLLVRSIDGPEESVLLSVPTVGLANAPGLWWLPGGLVMFDASSPGEGESDPDVWAVVHLDPADPVGGPAGGPAATPQPGDGALGPPVDPATVAAGMTLVVNDASAAVRSAPSADAPVVAELAQGSEVVALGPAETAGGFVWIPIRDPASGTIGYVRAELLSAAGGE